MIGPAGVVVAALVFTTRFGLHIALDVSRAAGQLVSALGQLCLQHKLTPCELAHIGAHQTGLLPGLAAVDGDFNALDGKGSVVLDFVDSPELSPPAAFVKGTWLAMSSGFQANTGTPAVDSLLSRGGMDSMLLTIWLIIGALAFGTMLDKFGLLSKLVIEHRARCPLPTDV